MWHLRTFGGLSIEIDRGAAALAPRRRPIALLALLAIAGEPGVSREKVVALLWPESDEDHGRNSLSQALAALRRDMATDDLVIGASELRLNPSVIASDVVEFERCISAGALDRAVALYKGPFLDGFFLREAADFERWADEHRRRLHHACTAALERLARAADACSDHEGAIARWRQLAALEPTSASAVSGLMRALATTGDRAGVRRQYRVHEELMRQEFGVPPDAAVSTLANRLLTDRDVPVAVPMRNSNAETEQAAPDGARSSARAPDDAPSEPQEMSDPRSVPRPTVRFSRRTPTVWLGAFAGLAAVYMIARVSGRDPSRSLLESRTLGRTKTVIVAAFQTRGADTSLGLTLAEVVRFALSTSTATQVVTQEQIGATLRLMEKPLDSRVDLATAREIAARDGIAAIVDGEIARVGSRYVAGLRLVTADSSRQLWGDQTTVNGEGELIGAYDTLSRSLRRMMGESLKSVNATPPLAKATTASTPALRWYTRSLIAGNRDGDYARAIELGRRAVAEDGTFGRAWGYLGALYWNVGDSRARRDSALERAYRFRDPMSKRDQDMIAARYFSVGPGRDRGRAIGIFREAMADGDSGRANDLGVSLMSRRDYAAAESMWVYARTRGTAVPPRQNLVILDVQEGKLVKAESTVAAAMSEIPAANTLWGLQRASIRYARGDVVGASAALDSIPITTPMNGETIGASAGHFRAGVAAVQGRITLARQLQAMTSAKSALSRRSPPPLFDTIALGNLDIVVGKYTRVVTRLDAALGLLRAAAPVDRPYLQLATLYARAGRPERASEILRQRLRELTDTAVKRDETPNVHRVLGEIALAERHGHEAVAEFWRSDSLPDGPSSSCLRCLYAILGRAYDVAGETDSTIAYLERYLATPDFGAAHSLFAPDPLFLAPAHERLGQLYEAKGANEKAAEHYRQFIKLWKNADQELQPRVAEARRRLQSLSPD